MKLLLLLPFLLGFSVPAIAHNEFNGGDAMHREPQNGCDDCMGSGSTIISVPKDNEFERE